MSALSEALDHSQAKALAALFKGYTRRADEPDDELFAGLMHKIGLDDDVQIAFLLAAWRIMRDDREALPAGNGVAPQSEPEPASDAQLALIRKLCDERKLEPPNKPLTKQTATQVIDEIKAGRYDPAKWTVPF